MFFSFEKAGVSYCVDFFTVVNGCRNFLIFGIFVGLLLNEWCNFVVGVILFMFWLLRFEIIYGIYCSWKKVVEVNWIKRYSGRLERGWFFVFWSNFYVKNISGLVSDYVLEIIFFGNLKRFK